MLVKAGILAKKVKLATAWREAKQQQRQSEHHSVNSRRETHNNKDARKSISRNANSTIWMPTAHNGHRQHNVEANNL